MYRPDAARTVGNLHETNTSSERSPLRILLISVIDYPFGGASSAHSHLVVKGLRANHADAALVIPHGESWGGMNNRRLMGCHDGIPFIFMSRSTDRPTGRMSRIWETLTAMRRSARFIAKRRAAGKLDAVMLYTPDFLKYFPIIFTCLRRKIPFFIWSVERMSFNRDKRGSAAALLRLSYRIAERILPRFAAGVIAITPSLKEYYQEIIDPDRIMISPIIVAPKNTNDPLPHAGPEGKRGSKNESSLLYAGSFAPKDGIPCLVEAFGLIASSFPDLHLVLLGKNDDPGVFAHLKRQVEGLGLTGRVEMPGFVSPEKLQAYYRTAKILLACRADTPFARYSIAWKMGEYALSGKPILAAKVGEVEKVFAEGKEIYLARPDDPGDIAKTITFILKDYPRALQVAAAAKEMASRDLDFIPQTARVLDFIKHRLQSG